MKIRRYAWFGSFCITLLAFTGSIGHALELEPGIYRNAPVGLNALAVGYGYSSGNILTDDSSVPIENAQARLNFMVVAYSRYMSLFGKAARADALAPFGSAHYEGTVAGQFMTRDIQGLADPKVRYTVFLAGAPALDRAQFKEYQQKTIWAVSLMMQAPFGQYDSARIINLGSNRWGFRPETGISTQLGRWVLEEAAGAWVYTANEDYYHGKELTQAPITYIKGDVIYSFARPVWLSFNYGYGIDGQSTVSGVQQADYQHNTVVGGTFSLALSRQDVVRLAYTKSSVSNVGPEFQTYIVVLAHQWGK